MIYVDKHRCLLAVALRAGQRQKWIEGCMLALASIYMTTLGILATA